MAFGGKSFSPVICPSLPAFFRESVILISALASVVISVGVAFAQTSPTRYSAEKLAQSDAERVSQLKSLTVDFRSNSQATFRAALDRLKSLDEEGAIDAWKVATKCGNSQLRLEAWKAYDQVKTTLWRNEFVPEVVAIPATPDEVSGFATANHIDVKVLGTRAGGSVVLLTPYALARLEAAGQGGSPIYPSLAALESAARFGNRDAGALYSEYRAMVASQPSQVRVAVVDRSKTRRPDAGYSDWLGDPEDIVAHNANYLAVLDIFSSDGSSGSVASHIADAYTHRGYSLAGFYTLDEFSSRIGKYFPGETFSPGTKAPVNKKSGLAPELANGQFHSYQQTLTEFMSLASANPTMAQVVQLGTTFEGREVFALKITSNVSTADPTKPDVLVTGCHHAREWISVEPPVYFAHQLLDNYNTDDVSRYLVDHLVIWIVPIVNPDGLDFSQQSPNDQLDTTRLWRKNRNPISIPECGSGIGVDLNRNYGFEWRLPQDQPCPLYFDDVGASDIISNETFRGPAPDSELEVKAIEGLTNDPNHHFVTRLDYHNFDQLVLYPWGYQGTPDVDSPIQSEIAQRMSKLIQSQSGMFYTPEQSIRLYITTGDSTDYSYAVDHTAIPMLVELRPSCCNFPVPEDQIGPIDQESWVSARALLEFAGGPPILQMVQAYQQGADGSFSRLVYSARWVDTLASSGSTAQPGRQLIIDTRFQALEPGPIQVRLQFSKPMDGTLTPAATLGRMAPFNELILQANGSAEGWQKTAYTNDTWIGEATIPSGGDTTDPWTLNVAASDGTGLNVDGDPSTIADYATGTGGWMGYEGQPTGDSTNVFPPSVQPGQLEIVVDSPMGGEHLIAGTPFTVNWSVTTNPGFTPTEQQLLFSSDSGITYTQIAGGISPSANSFNITLPLQTTAEGRIRVVARNTSIGSAAFGDSPANFTVGSNVGSGISFSLVSSQIISQAWSDTGGTSTGGAPASGNSQLAITVKVTNKGTVPVANPFLVVATLNKGDVLLSRDQTSPQEIGAVQSFDSGGGNPLAPGQSVNVTLTVGLVKLKKFTLAAQPFGVPIGGTIGGASPVTLWHAKPHDQ